jgi:hypothetical protein
MLERCCTKEVNKLVQQHHNRIDGVCIEKREKNLARRQSFLYYENKL